MLKLFKCFMIGIDIVLIGFLIYTFFLIDVRDYVAQTVDIVLVFVLLTAIWATKSIKLP